MTCIIFHYFIQPISSFHYHRIHPHTDEPNRVKSSTAESHSPIMSAQNLQSRTFSAEPSVQSEQLQEFIVLLISPQPSRLPLVPPRRVSDHNQSPGGQTCTTKPTAGSVTVLQRVHPESLRTASLTESKCDLGRGPHGGRSALPHHSAGRVQHVGSGQDETPAGGEPAAPAAHELLAGGRQSRSCWTCWSLRCC